MPRFFTILSQTDHGPKKAMTYFSPEEKEVWLPGSFRQDRQYIMNSKVDSQIYADADTY